VGQPHLLDLVEAPFAAGEQDLADHVGSFGIGDGLDRQRPREGDAGLIKVCP
jgi:hypothetical protein